MRRAVNDQKGRRTMYLDIDPIEHLEEMAERLSELRDSLKK